MQSHKLIFERAHFDTILVSHVGLSVFLGHEEALGFVFETEVCVLICLHQTINVIILEVLIIDLIGHLWLGALRLILAFDLWLGRDVSVEWLLFLLFRVFHLRINNDWPKSYLYNQ